MLAHNDGMTAAGCTDPGSIGKKLYRLLKSLFVKKFTKLG